MNRHQDEREAEQDGRLRDVAQPQRGGREDDVDILADRQPDAYEDAANARVLEMIAQVHGMPTTIFTMLLAKIYKRNK